MAEPAQFDEWGNLIVTDDDAPPVELTAPKLSYVQQKVAEFQKTLIDVDTTADMLYDLYVNTNDEQQLAEVSALLDEYESRKGAFRFAAESFNAVSNAVNAVGGNMPTVMIPNGLAAFPMVPAVAYAAIATGALILIDWAHNWITVSFNTATKAIADIEKTDPALANQLRVKQANAAAQQQSTTGSIATAAKWIGIAVLGWVAWQAFNNRKVDHGD